MTVLKRFWGIYWTTFCRVAWVAGCVMMVGFLVAAVSIATYGGQELESGMRWGLVALTTSISILSYFILKAAKAQFNRPVAGGEQ